MRVALKLERAKVGSSLDRKTPRGLRGLFGDQVTQPIVTGRRQRPLERLSQVGFLESVSRSVAIELRNVITRQGAINVARARRLAPIRILN